MSGTHYHCPASGGHNLHARGVQGTPGQDSGDRLVVLMMGSPISEEMLW